MKKFVLKIVIFSSTFIVLVILGYLIPDNNIPQNMHYSIYDKHDLLKNTPSDRIILVGGSGAAFGFYSPYIEQEFDKNVINTAIVGGYGLKYIIDNVIPYIREDDIVILSPEYEHLFNPELFYGDEALIQLLDAYPQAAVLLSTRQWYSNLWNIFKVSGLKIKNLLSLSNGRSIINDITPYQRRSFNKNGDIMGHWVGTRTTFTNEVIEQEFNEDALKRILEFSDHIKSMGGQFYINHSSINRSSYEKNKEKIETAKEILDTTGIKILGTPNRYSFADSLYFDSPYHLSRKGQLLRTKLFIEDLKRAH